MDKDRDNMLEHQRAMNDVAAFEKLLKERDLNFYEKTERKLGKQKYVDIKVSFKLA